MKKHPNDRYTTKYDPLEGYSLDEVVHVALGRAKDKAETGEESESMVWSAIAQAAATFHLSQNLGNVLRDNQR